jgi:hypothetical protein
MRIKRLLLLVPLIFFVWIVVGCASGEPDRQEQVAEAGSEVMPFDLERTTHIFEKLENGGLQQVISDDGTASRSILSARILWTKLSVSARVTFTIRR